MMKPRILNSVTLVLLAGSVFGYDTTGYVYMTGSDSTSATKDTSSFCSAGKWSDGLAPSSGKKYHVPKDPDKAGLYLRTPKDWVESGLVLTFAGSELAVAGILLPLGEDKNLNCLTIPNLVLLGGGELRTSSKHRRFFYGKTTVLESSRDTPATFYFNGDTSGDKGFGKGNYVHEHFATMVSDADQFVSFGACDNYYGNFALSGSQEEFRGTYLLNERTSLCLAGSTEGTVEVGSGALFRTWFNREPEESAIGGMQYFDPTVKNISVAEGGTIEVSASNVLTVANLHFAEGAKISILSGGGSCGRIVVTGSLTADGPVSLVMDNAWKVETGEPPVYSIISLAKGAAGDAALEQITLDDSCVSRVGTLPHISSKVVTDESQARTVSFTRREIVQLVNSGLDAEAYNSPLICGYRSDGQAYWSDGNAPSAGKDYYATGSSYSINIPECASSVGFAGDSLTLANGAHIHSGTNSPCAGFNVDELCMIGASYVRAWSGNVESDTYGFKTIGVGGKTISLSDAKGAEFCSATDTMIRVTSSLSGTGPVKVSSLSSSADAGLLGSVEFKGDNSAWGGKLTVSTARAIAGGRHTLGGPMAAFAYDGVLVGQKSRLRITADTVLDDANRGVTFEANSRVSVDSGCTLSIMNTVRLNGTLLSEGDGVLGFGSELTFVSGASTPTAGKNVIRLLDGGLKPMHAHSFDGAQIQFEADGLKLVYDIEPKTEEMLKFGLMNVKTKTPFVFNSDDQKFTVEFDFGTGPEGAPTYYYNLGLITVSDETLAKSLLDRIEIQKRYARNYLKLRIDSTEIDETTTYWTIVAEFYPKPSAMIIYH